MDTQELTRKIAIKTYQIRVYAEWLADPPTVNAGYIAQTETYLATARASLTLYQRQLAAMRPAAPPPIDATCQRPGCRWTATGTLDEIADALVAHTAAAHRSAPIQPELGGEYAVAGSAVLPHQGHWLDGVWLDPDGEAWAGQLRNTGHGEWLDLAEADYGGLVPAADGWAACITRLVPPIGTPHNQPSQQAAWRIGA